MKVRWLSLILISVLYACGSSNTSIGPKQYDSSIGPYEITSEYLDLIDTSRGWDDNGTFIPTREIPIKMYAPNPSLPGPFPVVLVSHGLGGNVEAVLYMAEHLAMHGYIVVAVQHHRSDSEYSGSLIVAASQQQTRLLRPQDMIFVLNWLSSSMKTAGYIVHGRMDLTKVGLIGHSFGAWTTLSCLGQIFDGGIDVSDPRFLCGVAYSPQGPGTMGLDTNSWDSLSRPTFTMAGTLDTSIGTPNANERRIPFDSMPATSAKYHATLTDAEHEDFGNNSADGFYYSWIKQMTLAFFDTNLRGNTSAKSWLDAGTIEDITSYVILEKK